jgi:hypothetical protein
VRVRLKLLAPGVVLMCGLVGCTKTNPRVVTALNIGAMLGSELPSNPLQNRVITSWIDKNAGTMSTLYGNDTAVQYARTGAQSGYPAGSALSVVTWTQQEDPRWFGGNIPAAAKSVEYVTIAPDQHFTYQRYEGSPLKQVDEEAGVTPNERTVYLLAQRAAVMP